MKNKQKHNKFKIIKVCLFSSRKVTGVKYIWFFFFFNFRSHPEKKIPKSIDEMPKYETQVQKVNIYKIYYHVKGF